MGNEDGIIEAMTNRGKNEIIKFNGGHFSFAMNNEIALRLENSERDDFFILNCDSNLWEIVKTKVKETNDKK